MDPSQEVMEVENQEKDFKILVLKEMASHPGWKLYQAHLARLSGKKEAVKSQALRLGNQLEALKQQFEIDGIRLAVSELEKLQTVLRSPEDEKN